MKKKIIFALITCLFAAGSIINMHLAQNNHNTDISLADISVMAQADGESGGGGLECICIDCPKEEFGCWSYDYTEHSYEGSWQCEEGPGRAEKNLKDQIPDACD